MNEIEKAVLDKFKALLLERISFHRLILFGSRARREAGPCSDMDVVVILADSSKQDDFDHVSDCAWEAGFEYGIISSAGGFLKGGVGKWSRTVLPPRAGSGNGRCCGMKAEDISTVEREKEVTGYEIRC